MKNIYQNYRSFLIWFAVCLLTIWVSRIGLLLWLGDRIAPPEGFLAFLISSLHTDMVLMGYFSIIPILIINIIPNIKIKKYILVFVLLFLAGLIAFAELSTPDFMREYDTRLDYRAYEYLIYPQEVGKMLWQGHKLALFSAPILTFIFLYFLGKKLFTLENKNNLNKNYFLNLLFFPFVLALIFIMARGTFGHRGYNLSSAAFSQQRLSNELALNSSFSFIHAVYNQQKEISAEKLYGNLDQKIIINIIQNNLNLPANFISNKNAPSLHLSDLPSELKHKNLVIIIEESLGTGFVGHLGGLNLTPNLDQLSHEGISFTKMYATGTRTARGMEAIVAGFPPSPMPSTLKLPKAQNCFATLGNVLKKQNYHTAFIYGGVANFDNMRGFYQNNGFETIIEQQDFKNPKFLGTWGISDEDLVNKSHALFTQWTNKDANKPFLAVMMSTTNHDPFEFPQGRIKPYETPLNTRQNAIQFADYAIGEFFKKAKSSNYWKNTVFVVVADHDARVYGDELLPVKHFRIPCVIIGNNIKPQIINNIYSQIDLAPSLLSLIGVQAEIPWIGRNIFNKNITKNNNINHIALMQFNNNYGYREENNLVVLQPKKAPLHFTLNEKDELTPSAPNTRLEERALAHVLWASQAYQNEWHVAK